LKSRYILFLYFYFLIGCSNNKNINSFYIWNSELQLDVNDFQYFEDCNISNLYIRLFDVEWNNGAKPIAEIFFEDTIPNNYNIIPVIYIKNEVLSNIEISDINDLASKLAKKILFNYNKLFPNHIISEIQLDCDWTTSTKEKYFYLLKEIQKNITSNIVLSVTIRLHQIKYYNKTGVPPVNKGVLMYYNMGDIKDFYESNSLLNNEIGKLYIDKKIKYPINLSLALPIYSWSVWFNYQKRFIGVLYSINSQNIKNTNFLEKQKNNIFLVVKDTVIESSYLRKGDYLRVEIPTFADLQIAKNICEQILGKKFEIILYNYSKSNINYAENETTKNIFNRK